MHLIRIRIRTSLVGLPGLLAVAVIASGCTTSLKTSHEPMHPRTGYVTLKAEATGLIDRVEIRMQRFTIDPVTGEESPDTPVLLVKVCDPSFLKKDIRCTYRAPWSGHGKMIEFEGKSILWNGTSRTEKYKFASGYYPFPRKPIPIRVKGKIKETLDIVIVPDADLYNDWYLDPLAGFIMFLDDIVEDVYFDYSAIRRWRGLYNFYYTPMIGLFNEDTCTFTGPDNLAELQIVADSLMYAHSREMWDCKLWDSFSSENWYGKSVAHETGHALIGLRDEYPGANYGAYPPHPCMSNIFPGQDACVAEAPDIGLPASYCVLVDPFWNIWRIDPAGATGSIMGTAQHMAWSDFGRASMRRINWRYNKCLAGDCFATDLCD